MNERLCEIEMWRKEIRLYSRQRGIRVGTVYASPGFLSNIRGVAERAEHEKE